MFAPAGRYIKDKELAQALVGQLARVGIRARLTAQDWGVFWPAVGDGKIPFWFGGRGSVIDPSEYLHQYFHTGVTKRIGFSDPLIVKWPRFLKKQSFGLTGGRNPVGCCSGCQV